jgi:hypothetical protein
MSKKGTTKRIPIERNDSTLDVGFYLRNYDKDKSDSNIYYLRKSHIISPSDEFIDLKAEDEGFLERAMKRTRHLWRTENKMGEPSYPNGEIVRNEFRTPQNPLLLLYFLDPEGANRPEDSIKITDPIVGYAISFPGSRFNASVNYAVHEQLLPLFSQDDYIDDMEDDED